MVLGRFAWALSCTLQLICSQQMCTYRHMKPWPAAQRQGLHVAEELLSFMPRPTHRFLTLPLPLPRSVSLLQHAPAPLNASSPPLGTAAASAAGPWGMVRLMRLLADVEANSEHPVSRMETAWEQHGSHMGAHGCAEAANLYWQQIQIGSRFRRKNFYQIFWNTGLIRFVRNTRLDIEKPPPSYAHCTTLLSINCEALAGPLWDLSL